MIHVYLDAKKQTLSAHSFPARIGANEMANSFSFNSHNTSATLMENYDFQYLTPTFHLDAIRCIVSSYQKIFFTKLLQNSLIAVSSRCDGSVDRMQVDKVYVLTKCVLKNGETKLFLGAAEPQIHGAEGIL